MNKLTLNAWGKDRPITLELANYAENGNLYVGLISYDEGYPEPWQNLTINLSVKCKPNRAFIDTNNNGHGIVDWLEQNKLGFATGNLMPSGWCVYPEFEFNMDEVMKYVSCDDRGV